MPQDPDKSHLTGKELSLQAPIVEPVNVKHLNLSGNNEPQQSPKKNSPETKLKSKDKALASKIRDEQLTEAKNILDKEFESVMLIAMTPKTGFASVPNTPEGLKLFFERIMALDGASGHAIYEFFKDATMRMAFHKAKVQGGKPEALKHQMLLTTKEKAIICASLQDKISKAKMQGKKAQEAEVLLSKIFNC